VRGDDQQHTADGDRHAGHDRPSLPQPERRDLHGNEPHGGEERQTETELGEPEPV
jgi:hypothetical protein